jgi:hypothetical protein
LTGQVPIRQCDEKGFDGLLAILKEKIAACQARDKKDKSWFNLDFCQVNRSTAAPGLPSPVGALVTAPRPTVLTVQPYPDPFVGAAECNYHTPAYHIVQLLRIDLSWIAIKIDNRYEHAWLISLSIYNVPGFLTSVRSMIGLFINSFKSFS